MAKLIEFQSDFKQRIMFVNFSEEENFVCNPKNLQAIRPLWLEELKKWHSPYTAVLDLTYFKLQDSGMDAELLKEWQRLFGLLKGLHLKKAVAFGGDASAFGQIELAPVSYFAKQDEAFEAAGVREFVKRVAGDFRSSILFNNQFPQQVVEVSFSQETCIQDKEQLRIFKDKLMNNLAQWHSAWTLFLDCSQLEIDQGMFDDFAKIVQFFKGFFLKGVIGHSPKVIGAKYPFEVKRFRHQAVTFIESDLFNAGDVAHCRTSKKE